MAWQLAVNNDVFSSLSGRRPKGGSKLSPPVWLLPSPALLAFTNSPFPFLLRPGREGVTSQNHNQPIVTEAMASQPPSAPVNNGTSQPPSSTPASASMPPTVPAASGGQQQQQQQQPPPLPHHAQSGSITPQPLTVAQQTQQIVAERPLNVRDALSYLDQVKVRRV